MSVLIVTPTVMDLVTFYCAHHMGDGSYFHGTGSAQALTQVLIDENHRAFNLKYRLTNAPPKTKYRPRRFAAAALETLSNCSLYDHQACESSDYGTTHAWEIVQDIRMTAIAVLPGYQDTKPTCYKE